MSDEDDLRAAAAELRWTPWYPLADRLEAMADRMPQEVAEDWTVPLRRAAEALEKADELLRPAAFSARCEVVAAELRAYLKEPRG